MRSSLTLIAAAAASLVAASSFAGGVPAVKTTLVAGGFSYPTFVTHAPGDTSRLFVLEKKGVIKIIDLETNTVLPTPFLNIDPLVLGGSSLNDEQGLLGLAFHPDYANNGYFFVDYTASSGAGDTRVVRYKVSDDDPNVADPGNALIVMTWDQPFSNHNGGWIGFGPDGYLYISTGDGGSANDPGNRAQDITDQKLGKLLRIAPNVEGDDPKYFIPESNPFVGVTGDDEIWAYGLRNPWRCSFDRETGDLYIGDVGQGAVEEIDVQPAGFAGGANYGWRCKEGTQCTGLSGCTCASPDLTNPVQIHTHGSGENSSNSITGGYVYRGCAYPELQGTYFYADWVLPNVWSFRWTEEGGVTDLVDRDTQISPSIQGTTVNQFASFGEDANGELYIVDHGGATTGQIFKIIPATGEVECKTPCPSDLTGDGSTDGADLAVLLGSWNTKGGDLTGDGMTDGADLAVLLGGWGPCN